MKTITFCFNHPVAVKVFFICTSNPEKQHRIKHLRSDDNGSLVIPLDGIESGKWRLMLEWSFEGRDFSLEKYVIISEDN